MPRTEKEWEIIRAVYKEIDEFLVKEFGDNDKPIMDLVENINKIYNKK